MSLSLVIEQAKPEDSSRIWCLAKEIVPNWSEKLLLEEIVSPNSRVWKASYAQDVVGLLSARFVGDEAEILLLAVRGDFRRQRVGTEMMDFYHAEMNKCGVRHVYLEVRLRNEIAQNFYARLGYKEKGLRRNYYDTPPDDAVLMSIEIGNLLQRKKLL